jgi:hypothetical protein
MLPSGPQWKVRTIKFEGYHTKEPIVLYYRDAEECVEYLLNNPLFADCMDFVPVKHYGEDGHRIFTEPISGQRAWSVQVLSIITLSLPLLMYHSGLTSSRCHSYRNYLGIRCHSADCRKR